MSYTPPFSITTRMLALVADIAEKVGRISGYQSLKSRPHLRRSGRIRSIHASLAIEANSLSLDEVKSVIDGKPVIGSQLEIQEVKTLTWLTICWAILIRIRLTTLKSCTA